MEERFIVTENEANQRLDIVLFKMGAAPSRSRVATLFKEGKVKVNGKPVKAHYILSLAEKVTYQKYTEKPLVLKEEEVPFDIVFENDDYLVINKPQGIVVHPGHGHTEGTLVNGLLKKLHNFKNDENNLRPGIVHRIDKDTSGLLLVTKNLESEQYFQNLIKDHEVKREYLALVTGVINENDGEINLPIGRDEKNPIKFKVREDGKPAVTYFHVEKRFTHYTLVSLRLLTGRTHQIRVHMDYIGHPVVGDPLYGENNRSLYNQGQLLHAYRLSFVPPKGKEVVSYSAPLPKYFDKILNKLN